MQTGSVKFFDAAKGYGFIAGDDGQDYFVHHTGIMAEGYRQLFAGDRVSFDVVRSAVEHVRR